MSENDTSTGDTDRLRPQCFNPNCDESFDTVDEMVAVPGRGDRSPRHFCESCAERLRRGPPMADGGTNRIHFLTDVRDFGAVYECKRCGHVTATKVEMYEHRRGLLSRCFRSRIKQKLCSLRAGTDRSEADDE